MTTQDWALPEIDLERCTGCGTCVELCPTGAVEVGPVGAFIARPEDCTYCAQCETLCPEGAIHLGYEIVWGQELEGERRGGSTDHAH
ncbi:MAG: ATP-binding protein [Anaerolineae bacterium]